MTEPSSQDPNLAPANNWKLKLSLFLNSLVLAILLNSIGAVALHVQHTFGVAESVAGRLAVFKSLGILAASMLTGFYLVRFGYRRAMLISLGGLAGLCLIVPSAPHFAMIKLLFFAAGASFAVIKVSVYATVGLVTVDRKSHAGLMSFLDSFFTAGIVAGYFLFGAFTDDAHPESAAWLNVFYVVAGLSLAALGLLLSARLDETRIHREPTTQPWREEISTTSRPPLTRAVLIFGACVFLYVMIEQSTMNWLPSFNRNVLHLPARLSLQLAGGFTVAMALGRLFAGVVLRRFSWFPVLAFCLSTSAGLVILALALTKNPALPGPAPGILPALVLPLIGFFIAPIYPTINSTMLSARPIHQQGMISSLIVIFSAFGSSVGTLAVGYLFETRGGHVAFYFTLLPIAALIAALFLLERNLRQSRGRRNFSTLAKNRMEVAVENPR